MFPLIPAKTARGSPRFQLWFRVASIPCPSLKKNNQSFPKIFTKKFPFIVNTARVHSIYMYIVPRKKSLYFLRPKTPGRSSKRKARSRLHKQHFNKNLL